MSKLHFVTAVSLISLALVSSTSVEARNLKICDHLKNFCVIYIASESDSDGDGVPDADELKARSDPKLKESIPRADILLDLVKARKLPSFENFKSILAMMPRPPSGFLGRSAGMPQNVGPNARSEMFRNLGISAADAGRIGIDAFDMTNGIALAKSIGPTSQLPSLGGIALGRMALYAEGSTTGLVVNATTATNAGPNGGKHATSVEGTKGGMKTVFSDGSHDEYSESANTGSTTKTNTSYNSEENLTGQTTSYESIDDGPEPGQFTHTKTSSTATKNENGSMTVTNSSTSSVVNARTLEETKEIKTVEVTTTKLDGSSTSTTTTTETTHEKGKPSKTETSTTTTSCDTDGTCSTTPSTASGQYVDPDNTNVVYITDKMVRQVVAFRMGVNTTPADIGNPIDSDSSFFNRPRKYDLIALFDPEAVSPEMTVLVAPDVWNTNLGTVRHVEGVTPLGPTADISPGTYDTPSNFENILRAVADIWIGQCVSEC